MASYGVSSAALGNLFEASNVLWSFGGSQAETIFDAGARSARIEAVEAGYDQSVASYRKTVLTAFQDVEDQLAALRILGEQESAQNSAVAAARDAERLTKNQYETGTVPYSSVIVAQTTTLTAEQTSLGIRQSRMAASVALIKALGGAGKRRKNKTRIDLKARPAQTIRRSGRRAIRIFWQVLRNDFASIGKSLRQQNPVGLNKPDAAFFSELIKAHRQDNVP